MLVFAVRVGEDECGMRPASREKKGGCHHLVLGEFAEDEFGFDMGMREFMPVLLLVIGPLPGVLRRGTGAEDGPCIEFAIGSSDRGDVVILKEGCFGCLDCLESMIGVHGAGPEVSVTEKERER